MAPLWQIRQVMTFDGSRHVNCCNHLGNGAGGCVFSSFACLVTWIAIFVLLLVDLFMYIDDNFSWEFADELSWYEPYRKHMPMKQVKLLVLWDELGIPHAEHKQEWGSTLLIIGFTVDPNAITIAMDPDRHMEPITALHAFAVIGRHHPLRDFQCMAGWINWALNVYPLL
jgi:hypothetical protein